MLVVGEKEVAASNVSIRVRCGVETVSQSFDSFQKTVRAAIADKLREITL